MNLEIFMAFMAFKNTIFQPLNACIFFSHQTISPILLNRLFHFLRRKCFSQQTFYMGQFSDYIVQKRVLIGLVKEEEEKRTAKLKHT